MPLRLEGNTTAQMFYYWDQFNWTLHNWCKVNAGILKQTISRKIMQFLIFVLHSKYIINEPKYIAIIDQPMTNILNVWTIIF